MVNRLKFKHCQLGQVAKLFQKPLDMPLSPNQKAFSSVCPCFLLFQLGNLSVCMPLHGNVTFSLQPAPGSKSCRQSNMSDKQRKARVQKVMKAVPITRVDWHWAQSSRSTVRFQNSPEFSKIRHLDPMKPYGPKPQEIMCQDALLRLSLGTTYEPQLGHTQRIFRVCRCVDKLGFEPLCTGNPTL